MSGKGDLLHRLMGSLKGDEEERPSGRQFVPEEELDNPLRPEVEGRLPAYRKYLTEPIRKAVQPTDAERAQPLEDAAPEMRGTLEHPSRILTRELGPLAAGMVGGAEGSALARTAAGAAS